MSAPTPILEAVYAGADDRACVRAYVADGWTPLHLAAYFGQADAVDILLRAGADVRAWSGNALRNQPLHAACAGRGNLRILMALLARGADVNAVEGGGYTPLHLAASRGEAAMVETLLARGASAHARTDDGRTALDVAAANGHAAVARRLRGEMP